MEALPLRRLGVTWSEAGVRVPLPARAGGLGGLPDSLARHPATTPCAVATLASPQSDRASECLSSPWPPGSLLPCLPVGPLPRRATARQGLPNPAPGCHEGCPSPLPGPELPAGWGVPSALQCPQGARVFNEDLRASGRVGATTGSSPPGTELLPAAGPWGPWPPSSATAMGPWGPGRAVPAGLGPGLHPAPPAGRGTGSESTLCSFLHRATLIRRRPVRVRVLVSTVLAVTSGK